MKFYPEESNPELEKVFNSVDEIKEAMINGEVLEGKVLLCDREHNLHIDLGVIRGVIPRVEGAIGIEDGSVRDIALISKVNKRVCFCIMGFQRDIYGSVCAILSRRAVQNRCVNEYISRLELGDVIDAKVTHLEKFGAFIDIGAGINALIPIDMLSVSRINHPNQRLKEGQEIKAVLRKREENKLTFSIKELLGTWQENADMFTSGGTVIGIVRSVEDYGVFVELAPNLAGLAEVCDGVRVGQQVAVYIKSIISEKMKIKLIIVESFDDDDYIMPLKYFVEDGRIDFWNYSPTGAIKRIYTDFTKSF